MDSDKYPVWGAKVDDKEYQAYFNIAKGIVPKHTRINIPEGYKAFDVWTGQEEKQRKGKIGFWLKPMSVKLIRKEK